MVELRKAFEGDMLARILKNITQSKPSLRRNKISKDLETLISLLLIADPNQRLDADKVISFPCVLRTCIDISLDLGRVENEAIEKLVNESLYFNDQSIRLPRSLPATLTISQESTAVFTQPTSQMMRSHTIQNKHLQ